MILVTGGHWSGKKEFVQETLGMEREDFSSDPSSTKAVFYFAGGLEPTDALLSVLKMKKVVIFPEMGCGLVPMDAKERLYRDEWGRIGCILAKEASEVYRVTMGIGVKIK